MQHVMKIGKRGNIDSNYRQYINIEIFSRFHLVFISSLKIPVNKKLLILLYKKTE